MGQLFFKKPLHVAIREGRKRTTIRRWDRPRVKAGQEAFAPWVGWLAIEGVEAVDLSALADVDAQADGFSSLGELCRVPRALYSDHARDGKPWFRVSFSVSRTLAPPRRAPTDAKQSKLFP